MAYFRALKEVDLLKGVFIGTVNTNFESIITTINLSFDGYMEKEYYFD